MLPELLLILDRIEPLDLMVFTRSRLTAQWPVGFEANGPR
jgi:hypothetical protein